VKIDNGTGGSRETSTGRPARVDDRGRESINFFAELKKHNVYEFAVAETDVSNQNRLVKSRVLRY
jgi:hypothetical protein